MKKNLNSELRRAQTFSANTIRLASLLLVVVTIIALGAMSYFTERGIVVSRDRAIHTYQVRSQLNDLQLEIMRAHTDETAFLLTPEKEGHPRSQQQAGLARHTLDNLRKLTQDNLNQQERLAQLEPLLEQGISLIEGGRGAAGNRTYVSPPERIRQEGIDSRQKQIDAIVTAMQDEEEVLLEQRLRDWDYLFKRNVLMLGLAFSVVAIMLAYNFRLLIVEVIRTKDTEKRVRANAESYKLMSAKILELQDSERRRIARELHDSVGQFLAGLKINLSQLDSANGIDKPKLIRDTLKLTDYAIQEVRTISHLLHPPLLEELGFLSAARWYVDEYGKRGQVRVSLSIDEPIERLPRDIEIALFRVLQETLTNVYRHAAAQAVDVRIMCQDGHVHLTVSDNGKGIPEETLAKFRDGAALGIGLAGMRERLAEFGGQINVESSSAGSEVEAVIPTGVFERKTTVPANGDGVG
jgi:signal transduction histidine kinase